MPGRSVRLFLIDGTPQGMRTAEVGNWTGLERPIIFKAV